MVEGVGCVSAGMAHPTHLAMAGEEACGALLFVLGLDEILRIDLAL